MKRVFTPHSAPCLHSPPFPQIIPILYSKSEFLDLNIFHKLEKSLILLNLHYMITLHLVVK